MNNIVIVGGGTAGWMAAASLIHYLKGPWGKGSSVTLIESSEIGTVGVGEATIPSIVRFNHNLGIDELEFIRATGATFKLGIQFENWKRPGELFFHPFSDYGISNGGVDFHHYFNRLKMAGHPLKLEDFSLGCQLAKEQRFAQPRENPPTPLADYDYAYHFDAARYASFLRDRAENDGVRRIDQKVAEVRLRQDDGFIDALQLQDGSLIRGDLFIDCTGFRGLLIEEALKTGYEDWSNWLLCDRAVAVQCESNQPPLPYTRTSALAAGWQWRIPLQHRLGSGYVFSSKFLDNDSATRALLDSLDTPPLNEPRPIRFQAGRRKQVWNKNCYALGLASGFLEPLESTSISLIQTGITHLLTFFPHGGNDPAIIAEVNRRHRHEMETLRDFIILHYKLNQRTDSTFWTHCREMDIPESLQHKIDLYQSCGHIALQNPEAFSPSSWLTMYQGFAVLPERYDPRVDLIPEQELIGHLQRMQAIVQQAGSQAPLHHEFLSKHCRAN